MTWVTKTSLLEISQYDISLLGDAVLRELVARLCRAELAQAGLRVSTVTAGGGQDDPDGGIDVRVDLPEGSHRLDFVPRARTGFQVKATKMAPSSICAEMRPRGQLRPAIKKLLASAGAYVIVGSKDSTGDSSLQSRRGAMRKALGRTAVHPDSTTDFIGADRLADWTNCYPGVVLWVREQLGLALMGWFCHGNWANDTPDGEFVFDDCTRVEAPGPQGTRQLSVIQTITEIRRALAQAGGAVRLLGLSGTGKTRLAQALFDGGVGQHSLASHLAVYGDLGREPRPSAQEMLHRLLAHGSSVVLVVDNCNPETHHFLVSALEAAKANVSLLTVEYDVRSEDEPEATEVYRLHGTSANLLDSIISRHVPRLSAANRERIEQLSDGNAKLALVLARAALRTGNLGTLKDAGFFSRFFWQRGEGDPKLERAAHVISLVYSFDATWTESEDHNELTRLSALASTSPAELLREVARLQRRGLVQRRGKWRALLPHALANRLAVEALEEVDDAMLGNCLGPTRDSCGLSREGCRHCTRARVRVRLRNGG